MTPVQGKDGDLRGLVLSLYEVTERIKTRRVLRQYADRLEILREIDQAILAARSIGELTRSVVNRIPQLIPCVYASVGLFNSDQTEFSLITIRKAGESELGRELGEPLPQSWVNIIDKLAQGESCIMNDIQALWQS